MRTSGERFVQRQEVASVVVSQRGNILDVPGVHYRNGYWKTVKSRHKFTLETRVLFVQQLLPG